MKTNAISFLSALVLTAGLMPSGGALAGRPAANGGYEQHPMIHRAIHALEAAKGDLQNAAHDYCGHRVEALEAVNNALSQLGLAIACDNRNDRRNRSSEQTDLAETSPAPAGAAGLSGEPHPLIRAAVNALRNARKDLAVAAHDYCGHRVEALESVNRALAQLQLALKCDRR